jgi:hypothetical protein
MNSLNLFSFPALMQDFESDALASAMNHIQIFQRLTRSPKATQRPPERSALFAVTQCGT